MDNPICILLGVGIVGGIIYSNSEKIQIEFTKQQGIYKAKKLVKDFFIDELKKNPQITLNNAILKFEDTKNEFNSLEEFTKDKTRKVESYIKAYGKIFDQAKKEY